MEATNTTTNTTAYKTPALPGGDPAFLEPGFNVERMAPSIFEVSAVLRSIRDDMVKWYGGPDSPEAAEGWPEWEGERTDDGVPFTDVRLQIHEGWMIHEGDSSYDQDHHGGWGCSSVCIDDTDDNLDDTAASLIDQALEMISDGISGGCFPPACEIEAFDVPKYYSHRFPPKSPCRIKTFTEDSYGDLWALLQSCGPFMFVKGIVRARSFEDAYETCEDEIMDCPTQEDMDGWFKEYDIPVVDPENPSRILSEDERWELLHNDGAWQENYGFRSNADGTQPGGQYCCRDYDERLEKVTPELLEQFDVSVIFNPY